MKNRTVLWVGSLSIYAALLLVPSGSRAQSKGETVEEIVARVNNQIITMSDYHKAAAGLQQEAQQDCQNCTQAQIQTVVAEHQVNLLRDMIDQQLLIERAKDMDLNMETELIKRLDDVRKEKKMRSQEHTSELQTLRH